MTKTIIENFRIALPSLPEQRRIATLLREQMAAVEQARAAAKAQLALLGNLISAYLRESLDDSQTRRFSLGTALDEVIHGVGQAWVQYRVVGATRAGLAPAKEKVGKSPERYKVVDPGTIFYNPMRILLGSIAMIDEGSEPGITSPDYVVFKTCQGTLHPRWFYYWLRSSMGDVFIKTLARGAVRERMLFRRLAAAEIDRPPWEVQVRTAEKLLYVSETAKKLNEQLVLITALPQALLRRAFSGKL